jgi:hypothetical protein
MNLAEIERLTREYSKQRAALADKVGEMQTEAAKIRKIYLESIKRAVERAGEAHAALFQAIQEAPELFQKPKSLLLCGITVGYRKAKDRAEWADNEQLAAKIQELFPELYPTLVKVERKPLAKALLLMGEKVLKQLGVTLDRGTDSVIIEADNSEIDRLVEALVREAEQETEVGSRQ